MLTMQAVLTWIKPPFDVLLHLYIRHLQNNFPPLQVTIFFNGKLFRGNKSTKVDAKSFSVFDSPSYPPLAKLSNNGGNKCIPFLLTVVSLFITNFLLSVVYTHVSFCTQTLHSNWGSRTVPRPVWKISSVPDIAFPLASLYFWRLPFKRGPPLESYQISTVI